MNISPDDLIHLLDRGGVLMLMLIIIYTAFKDVWCWTRERKAQELRAEQAERERDVWRDIALTNGRVADAVAEKSGAFSPPQRRRRERVPG